MTTGETSAQVVVAGAGIAGIETALALKAFAGDAVRVTLVDPGRQFRIPATATGRAFGVGRTGERLLAEVAARAGATLTPGRVTAVDPRRHLLMLAGGRLLTYDALVVAIGAWALPSVPGALHFTGHDDVVAVRGMIDEIGAGAARGAETDLAIVVPDDCTWPLAAYELALMAHDHLLAGGAAHAVRISVVTAEQTPLAVFGPDASASVARMLGRAGVAVHAGSQVAAWSWGRLEIAGGDALAADRVIALPLQRGPALDGLPADSHGFVRAADDGGVPGCPDVWAVGDGSTFPVKQGGIACQQADSVASVIARRMGADVEEVPFPPTLRGWIGDGGRARFLQSDLHGAGPAADAPPWWPVAKVAGRFLSPFLADWPSGEIPALPGNPVRRAR